MEVRSLDEIAKSQLGLTWMFICKKCGWNEEGIIGESQKKHPNDMCPDCPPNTLLYLYRGTEDEVVKAKEGILAKIKECSV